MVSKKRDDNKNVEKFDQMQAANYLKTAGTIGIIILLILLPLYIYAIILNFKFIGRCSVSFKFLHYLWAIFSAPSYLMKTLMWPALCNAANKITDSD
jgi:hypothetical protein